MPHMSNLPWVSAYIFTFLVLLVMIAMLHAKTEIIMGKWQNKINFKTSKKWGW